MADFANLGKALFGNEQEAVVKSGTLAVTRFTGWVGAIAVVLTNTEVLGELTTSQKLWGSIAILGVFAFIAAADAIARGYVTGQSQPEIRALPSPVTVAIPTEHGTDAESGWKALLIRTTPQAPDEMEFWVVKGETSRWISGKDVRPS